MPRLVVPLEGEGERQGGGVVWQEEDPMGGEGKLGGVDLRARVCCG